MTIHPLHPLHPLHPRFFLGESIRIESMDVHFPLVGWSGRGVLFQNQAAYVIIDGIPKRPIYFDIDILLNLFHWYLLISTTVLICVGHPTPESCLDWTLPDIAGLADRQWSLTNRSWISTMSLTETLKEIFSDSVGIFPKKPRRSQKIPEDGGYLLE